VSCAQCQGIVRQFDARVARRELRRFRRRGPSRTTRRLLSAISARGVSGRSILDIGGGVGAIQHHLMDGGASSGTCVDASPAYLSAARTEAKARGYVDRMRYVQGDFVAVASDVRPADVVTLDRVLCCYPDMPALVDASAARARLLLGLVLPRVHLLTWIGVRLVNVIQRIRRHPFRTFLHPPAEVDERLRARGLRPAWQARSLLWHLRLYERDEHEPSTD
jgi:magnesium-protoporphyrin O-methyltransferase